MADGEDAPKCQFTNDDKAPSHLILGMFGSIRAAKDDARDTRGLTTAVSIADGETSL